METRKVLICKISKVRTVVIKFYFKHTTARALIQPVSVLPFRAQANITFTGLHIGGVPVQILILLCVWIIVLNLIASDARQNDTNRIRWVIGFVTCI